MKKTIAKLMFNIASKMRYSDFVSENYFNRLDIERKKNKILEDKLKKYLALAEDKLSKLNFKPERMRPKYYQTQQGGDLIDKWLEQYYPRYVVYFCMMNAEKYIQREGKKDVVTREWSKVAEYCKRGLEIIEKQNNGGFLNEKHKSDKAAI